MFWWGSTLPMLNHIAHVVGHEQRALPVERHTDRP
jgi:hypothetical protein